MPSKNTGILELNQYQKSDEAPFITYADLECLIQRTDAYKNNPENSFKTKISEHDPSGFPMSTKITNLKFFCDLLRSQNLKRSRAGNVVSIVKKRVWFFCTFSVTLHKIFIINICRMVGCNIL